MIIPNDKVVFNSKYDIKKIFSETYTVEKVGKVVGTWFVWLKEIDGFFPLDSVELKEVGEL